MTDFKTLNLSKALQNEEEEDELDRLMAGQATQQAQAPSPEPVESPDAMLADLLSDDDELAGRKAVVTPRKKPEKSAPTERKKPRHVGTPRARVTAKDALLLGFLGKFRIATAEALSMLQVADAGPRTKGGQLTSVVTIENRLAKLERLGVVQIARMSGYPQFYGTNAEGVAAARAYGYLIGDDEADGKGASGVSLHNVPHRLAVSHVAAKFMNPQAPFKRTLGVEPLTLDQLISERTIERYRGEVQIELDRDRAADLGDGSFGAWRKHTGQHEAANMARSGRVPWSEVMDYNPALWSLGYPSNAQAQTKDNHDPDLVLNLESQRVDAKPVSIFVEVELSYKTKAELRKILRTYAYEFKEGMTYKQVFYFIGGNRAQEIAKAIKSVDKVEGFGLHESGRLRFIPLTARDGSPLTWVKTWSEAR